MRGQGFRLLHGVGDFPADCTANANMKCITSFRQTPRCMRGIGAHHGDDQCRCLFPGRKEATTKNGKKKRKRNSSCETTAGLVLCGAARAVVAAGMAAGRADACALQTSAQQFAIAVTRRVE